MDRRSFLGALGLALIVRKLPKPNSYVTEEDCVAYVTETNFINSPANAQRMADSIRRDLDPNGDYLMELDPGDWQIFKGRDVPRPSFGGQIIFQV